MLPAVGTSLVLAGIAAFLAYVLPTVGAWICGVGTLLLLGVAARLALRPPVVVRLSRDGMRFGGLLTSAPVTIGWLEVEDVRVDDTRLYLDRGGDSVLAVPTALVGSGRARLLRDIYDRLNAAHGYRRFDPS